MRALGRNVCGDLTSASSREWLVTNGIGGYAMGTVAGLNTRRYHGLLVAALEPPVRRTVMASKIDETLTYAGESSALHVNAWWDGTIEGHGYRHLERFRLADGVPVWTFAVADLLIEKRIRMLHGRNATVVTYSHVRGFGAVTVHARILMNYRDHHGATRGPGWTMDVSRMGSGVRVHPFDGATPSYVTGSGIDMTPRHVWMHGLRYPREDARGLPALEDVLHAADADFTLAPGKSVAIVLAAGSAVPAPSTPSHAASRARTLVKLATPLAQSAGRYAAAIRQLILAADQFIVRRTYTPPGTPSHARQEPTPSHVDGHSIIAGYPWFADWGRDAMIALPGLTLATGRFEVAASVLRTFAASIRDGLVPNRFPDDGQEAEFNTADASLWFVEAARAYLEASGDRALIAEIYPALTDVVARHRQGTRHGIGVDPDDGLLRIGETDSNLTWMDAVVDGRAVTPRTGKPVEINALWFNALTTLGRFASMLGLDDPYSSWAQQARRSFGRFWNAATGCLYDVIDVPNGHDGSVDASIRPNQLLAVSLAFSPLDRSRQRAVVDACARTLLTSHGLRSLAPSDEAYRGRYAGTMPERDASYHQGTTWAWLVGVFATAHLRVYGNRRTARSFLLPLLSQLEARGLGTLGEVFDGDVTPLSCPAAPSRRRGAWQRCFEHGKSRPADPRAAQRGRIRPFRTSKTTGPNRGGGRHDEGSGSTDTGIGRPHGAARGFRPAPSAPAYRASAGPDVSLRRTPAR